MKEQLERVVAWAKSHPWMAAGVLGLIVLLAYLAYKKGLFGGGGGSSSTDTSGTPTPDSGATADTGQLGGVTSGATTGTVTSQDIGQSSTPIPVSVPTISMASGAATTPTTRTPTDNQVGAAVSSASFAPFTAPTALPAVAGYSGYNRQTGNPVVGKVNLKYQAKELKLAARKNK